MPVFDGMSALKIVKDFDPHLPFIILTGSMNEDIAVECLKAGASDYVTKEHQGRLGYAIREAISQKFLFLKAQAQEESLRESEERYRSIFVNSNAVMLIINPQDSKIIDVNDAAVGFYGWTREELLQKYSYDINTLPLAALNETIRRAIIREKNHFQFKHKCADGSIRDVESHAGPIKIGSNTYLLSIIHDISERLAAEQERDLISKRLSHYLQMSPTITYSLRIEEGVARIEWVSENIESILGYPVNEAKQAEWWFNHVVSADRAAALKGIPALIEKKHHVHEYRFIRKDRKTVWIRDDMRLVEGETGNAEIVGTLTDVSNQKSVEDEIKLKSAALEALDTAVVITDRDGTIQWANHG